MAWLASALGLAVLSAQKKGLWRPWRHTRMAEDKLPGLGHPSRPSSLTTEKPAVRAGQAPSPLGPARDPLSCRETTVSWDGRGLGG